MIIKYHQAGDWGRIKLFANSFALIRKAETENIESHNTAALYMNLENSQEYCKLGGVQNKR
jgi:hypothetical protein